ncbi:MAG: hypothetical protein KIS81_03415 [Maricaulaceae bacterium]|nr:hypothetical protein [Maricaulaceae bacterium]
MRPIIVSSIAALLALSLTACSSLVTGGPLVRPGEPTATLVINNRSGYTLTAVLISDCRASTYGLNRLPSGTTIPPGRSYPFTVSAGCWDVMTGLGTASSNVTSRGRHQVRAGQTFVLNITG